MKQYLAYYYNTATQDSIAATLKAQDMVTAVLCAVAFAPKNCEIIGIVEKRTDDT